MKFLVIYKKMFAFVIVALFSHHVIISQEILYPFSKNKKYGYLNIKGKVIIPAEFDSAEPFYEELAMVKQAGKFGFIDVKGKFVIAAQYDL